MKSGHLAPFDVNLWIHARNGDILGGVADVRL